MGIRNKGYAAYAVYPLFLFDFIRKCEIMRIEIHSLETIKEKKERLLL